MGFALRVWSFCQEFEVLVAAFGLVLSAGIWLARGVRLSIGVQQVRSSILAGVSMFGIRGLRLQQHLFFLWSLILVILEPGHIFSG